MSPYSLYPSYIVTLFCVPQVWQYVTLMKRIYLIDCPGVVYPSGETQTEIVLKSVVRSFLLSASHFDECITHNTYLL